MYRWDLVMSFTALNAYTLCIVCCKLPDHFHIGCNLSKVDCSMCPEIWTWDTHNVMSPRYIIGRWTCCQSKSTCSMRVKINTVYSQKACGSLTIEFVHCCLQYAVRSEWDVWKFKRYNIILEYPEYFDESMHLPRNFIWLCPKWQMDDDIKKNTPCAVIVLTSYICCHVWSTFTRYSFIILEKK